jgi:PAS domain S-box-containing protein
MSGREAAAAAAWPQSDGEMAWRIRCHDWAATPLGAIEGWAGSLRSAIEVMLPSGLPMLVAWGPDLIQIYNDALRALAGTKHPGAFGRPVAEIWAETWQVTGPLFRRALGGESITVENLAMVVDRGGAPKQAWFTASFSPLRDERGHPCGVMTVIVETTARVLAELALRDSEERFRLIVEGARDYAIFTTDDTGLVTSWPPGAAAVFGWSETEILGRPVDLTFVPEDVANGDPAKELALARRDGVAPDVREHLRKDGARIFIDGSTRPLVGGDGVVRGFIKIGQDVTEHRRADQRLRDSEARLRTLIQGIPQLVWRAGDQGRWTWSSPQWQAYTGQSLADSLDLGWLDAIHPDDRAATARAWQDAGSRRALAVEHRVRRAADGEHLWHHTRSTPLTDAGGAILEWLGTSTDVQQLRELQERQGVMIAELQHRTRNLIAVMRAIASQTMAVTGPTEAFREAFNDRLEALARVQGLLSRSDAEPITVRRLIGMELEAMGVPEKGGLARLDGPPVVLRHSMVQTLALALHELATNARKHGALSTGSGSLQVSWRVREAVGEGRRLTLEWREIGATLGRGAGSSERGYGRQLIERALPYALGAKTSYELGAHGVRCTIDLPLAGGRRPGRSQ